jgi:hypothetical protein
MTIVAWANISQAHAPGENVTWYLIGYGVGRFYFDFFRGDVGRTYIRSFSEAQWTSWLFVVIVSVLEKMNILPFNSWHLVASALITLSFLGLWLLAQYYRPTQHQIVQPDHIMEVYQTLNWLFMQNRIAFSENRRAEEGIYRGATSLGIEITLYGFLSNSNALFCYRLSKEKGELTRDSAKTVSRLIVLLKHKAAIYKIAASSNGTFDLLVRDCNSS